MGRVVISALVTNCSARKTVPPAAGLTFNDLVQGSQGQVADQWKSALKRAPVLTSASDLYCGRGVRRMQRLATHISARLFIASAGLGLVRSGDRIPSYNLSVSPGIVSAVQRRVSGEFSAKEWWGGLQESKYAVPFQQVFGADTGLVLIAVSSAYVPLLTSQLCQLESAQRDRLRLFGAVDSRYPHQLSHLLLPYDKRLDALVRGPKIDFAQRAAEHFISGCISGDAFPATLELQRAWVNTQLEVVASLSPKKRQVVSDAEIRAIAAKLAAQGICQTRALSILRQQRGVACEQRRFRRLFLEVAE